MATQERVLKTKHYAIIDGPNYSDFRSVPHSDHSLASIEFRTSNGQQVCTKVSSYQCLDEAHNKVFVRGYVGHFRGQYWHRLHPFTAEYNCKSRSGQLAITNSCIARDHPTKSPTLHDYT